MYTLNTIPSLLAEARRLNADVNGIIDILGLHREVAVEPSGEVYVWAGYAKNHPHSTTWYDGYVHIPGDPDYEDRT